jgi:hypothetical protein
MIPIWPASITLVQLLERAAHRDLPSGWVFLPEDWRTWKEETPAYIVDDEALDSTNGESPVKGYCSVVEPSELESLVLTAAKQFAANSFVGWLEVLIYYYRFDAFLPRPGAPDPPTGPQAMVAVDRKFYDSLGSERSDVACAAAGCTRGAITLSVLCKVHHFEQIKRRPCPFSD